MCGIAGFIDSSITYDSYRVAKDMGEAIRTRGPDSDGIWQNNNLGINLVHRRLAILDLSPAGHQPMVSKSERFVMVFNGEIYNYRKIKCELEQKHEFVNWRGHSDTEVILLAIEVYGLHKTLEMLEGMFAIALWDKAEDKLYLARDRVGEKPLYYGYFNGVFAFTSELKAFKKHPKFNPKINRDAIGQLMLHNCIPAPLSIYEDIHKVLPGYLLEISYKSYLVRSEPILKPYWQLSNCNFEKYSGSFEDATDNLEGILSGVVQEQMVADVSVGCFLSGGVDSSVIAALMQKNSRNPIKTFSIGFDNKLYDEAIFAKDVANHIGSDHTELYVTERDALNIIPLLPSIYDEPFSDSSQIPTFLVSKMARQDVTVALSGDGGDELFAGYNRYLLSENLHKNIYKYPDIILNIVKKCLPLITPGVLGAVNKILKFPVTNLGDKIYKLEPLLSAKEFNKFYLNTASHWINYDQLVLGSSARFDLWDKPIDMFDFGANKVLGMQYLDTLGYLPDDILVKVDRAAMANSLETRVPLLNHKIIEFAFSLPLNYKIGNGCTKRVLREVLYRHIPKELIERPKNGFGIPINQWLRGELKEWACDLLSPDVIKNDGYFNVDIVQNTLNSHLSGKSNNGYYLWDVLMFQQWLKHSV